MDDLKQRVEQSENDYWKAMAVSSAAMHIYEEAKINFEEIEDNFNRLRREMKARQQ